jgi:hypothetical protein
VLRVAFIDDGMDETHMGCLVNDLWDLRQSRSSSPPNLSRTSWTPQLFSMAWEVLRGMQRKFNRSEETT